MPEKPLWMRAKVEGAVERDGSIVLDVIEIEPGEGHRPVEAKYGGADPAVLHRLTKRIQGPISTWCWPGGATALSAPFCRLQTLPENLVTKLEAKYGVWEIEVLLNEVRNTGAPYIWNVAEPSGGMAQSANLELEAMLEIVEMGFYREDGWASFDVSKLAERDYSTEVLAEQERLWRSIDPSLERRCAVKLLPNDRFGTDFFNGRRGIISVRKDGDLGFLTAAYILLEENGWCLRDLEEHFDPQSQTSSMLNRKIVGIVQRIGGRSPLMLEFAPDGGLDECGLHVALSGEALTYNIGHLTRYTLESRGLGWIKA